ncbi:DUF2508 family protein [Alicyclobacillus ferrooxydans]|uniref:DUF2508 family protein n=1 Tax=Alicyclobacillus ferrooxydans TaxID=471514 RepID=UPI0006D54F34|nr:DUF2508 family protein [Alicyclobacillus ferrooxydans]
MTDSDAKQASRHSLPEVGVTTEQTAKDIMSIAPFTPVPEEFDAPRMEFSEDALEQFLYALKRSKQELDIARQQFENATDQRLIDHVVFRLGAAERHFSYMLQLARQWGISANTIRWDRSDEA